MVAEVEHFYRMVENHKGVPYRGVFKDRPKDPNARVDPPLVGWEEAAGGGNRRL